LWNFYVTVQLGIVELLCSLCTHQPGVVLVLPAQQVPLVFQFFQSHDHLWWF